MVDREYWNQYYKQQVAPTNCSSFASSVLPVIDKTEILIEIGCGNGRDSFYYASQGIPTWACDLSEASIEMLNSKATNGNPKFMVQDFTNIPSPLENTYFGTVYSRFTLHSVPAEGAARAMKWAFENLKEGGLFLIEARSILDPMCGVGIKVEGEEDAYINTHYRRFLRRERLVKELTDIGFVVEFQQEENNLAVYKDDNPVVIRIHARKPKATPSAV